MSTKGRVAKWVLVIAVVGLYSILAGACWSNGQSGFGFALLAVLSLVFLPGYIETGY
jgi:hypothetical protein